MTYKEFLIKRYLWDVPKTIQDINGIINKFLKWCRRNKKTTYRPDDVHIPANARLRGKTVLQPNDLTTLLTVETTMYKGKPIKEEYIHAYRFQVLTGLRPGELRGLRVEDVNGSSVLLGVLLTYIAKKLRVRMAARRALYCPIWLSMR